MIYIPESLGTILILAKYVIKYKMSILYSIAANELCI